MSVLNYAPSINSIIKGTNILVKDNYIGANILDPSIVFTGDKHLITHGVDLLADYSNCVRGLVPSYNGTENVIFTKEGWKSPKLITVENANVANVAKKVENALTIGTGLLFTDSNNSYDGSTAKTLSLKPATKDTLGGVIVNDPDYLTISDSGSLEFNKEALKGFIGGEITSAKYTLSAEEISGLGIKLKLSGLPGNSDVSIKHSNGINIGINESNVTISLLEATDTTLGGIMTGYTPDSINRNYAVDIDEFGKAFVNVPWTWREIRIGGKSIGDSILDIGPSSDIVMSYENEETGDLNDGIATISFKLGIFNLSSGEWEYDN